MTSNYKNRALRHAASTLTAGLLTAGTALAAGAATPDATAQGLDPLANIVDPFGIGRAVVKDVAQKTENVKNFITNGGKIYVVPNEDAAASEAEAAAVVEDTSVSTPATTEAIRSSAVSSAVQKATPATSTAPTASTAATTVAAPAATATPAVATTAEAVTATPATIDASVPVETTTAATEFANAAGSLLSGDIVGSANSALNAIIKIVDNFGMAVNPNNKSGTVLENLYDNATDALISVAPGASGLISAGSANLAEVIRFGNNVVDNLLDIPAAIVQNFTGINKQLTKDTLKGMALGAALLPAKLLTTAGGALLTAGSGFFPGALLDNAIGATIGTVAGTPLGALPGAGLGSLLGSIVDALTGALTGSVLGSPIGSLLGSGLGAFLGGPVGALLLPNNWIGGGLGAVLGALAGTPLALILEGITRPLLILPELLGSLGASTATGTLLGALLGPFKWLDAIAGWPLSFVPSFIINSLGQYTLFPLLIFLNVPLYGFIYPILAGIISGINTLPIALITAPIATLWAIPFCWIAMFIASGIELAGWTALHFATYLLPGVREVVFTVVSFFVGAIIGVIADGLLAAAIGSLGGLILGAVAGFILAFPGFRIPVAIIVALVAAVGAGAILGIIWAFLGAIIFAPIGALEGFIASLLTGPLWNVILSSILATIFSVVSWGFGAFVDTLGGTALGALASPIVYAIVRLISNLGTDLLAALSIAIPALLGIIPGAITGTAIDTLAGRVIGAVLGSPVGGLVGSAAGALVGAPVGTVLLPANWLGGTVGAGLGGLAGASLGNNLGRVGGALFGPFKWLGGALGSLPGALAGLGTGTVIDALAGGLLGAILGSPVDDGKGNQGDVTDGNGSDADTDANTQNGDGDAEVDPNAGAVVDPNAGLGAGNDVGLGAGNGYGNFGARQPGYPMTAEDAYAFATSPDTGDNNELAVFGVLGALSAAAYVGTRRRREQLD